MYLMHDGGFAYGEVAAMTAKRMLWWVEKLKQLKKS
jgi:hypothetical protein